MRRRGSVRRHELLRLYWQQTPRPLDRTQPLLPKGLGYVEGVSHDDIRHGTTTLFAPLDVATGSVIAECKRRHLHQEFLSFLRRIDKEVPTHLDVHLIVENYGLTSTPTSAPGWRSGQRFTSTKHQPKILA